MVLFLQLDIRAEWGIAVAADSHLSIFMSPSVNEIPSFEFPPVGKPLPPELWTRREPHCKVFLHPPGAADTASAAPDPYLQHQALSFEPGGESDIWVGGEPDWYQDPDRHLSPAGEPMVFVAQLAVDVPFPRRPEAPPQPDSFSRDDYCLFLGNAVYLLADPAQPHPEAVWVGVQN